MKKLVGFFVAALLIFGLAGQGMAAFEQLDLIRVVYKNGGTGAEVGTDMGAVTSLVSTGDTFDLGNFNLSMFAGSSWGDLRVSYFAYTNATQDVWVASTASSLTSLSGKWQSLLSGMNGTRGYYAGSTSFVDGVTTTGRESANVNSYWKKLDGNGTLVGKFAQFLPVDSEASLAQLATQQGYVDQYLYFFDNPNTAADGVKVAMIRTMADGSTIITPMSAPVPIPPSVLLLGAGLLGLIGIRRRTA